MRACVQPFVEISYQETDVMAKYRSVGDEISSRRAVATASSFRDENGLPAVNSEQCECKDGLHPSRDRRRFLAAGASAMTTGAATLLSGSALAAPPPGAKEYPVPVDPTKEPGLPTEFADGYGLRSQFETEARWRFPTPTVQFSWSHTPLQNSRGTITPSGLHYVVNRAGTPVIDPQRHRFTVHGMVKHAKVYTMKDLMRFPSVTRTHFLECAGNTFMSIPDKPMLPDASVQVTHGLTSNSEWTGVKLSTILREVGVEEGAGWVLAEGSDAAVMTRSVPLQKCWDDAMLAYAQNGEALRPEQGYPLRLIVPGWEGNINVKWLRRLKIGDKPWYTRMETKWYDNPMPGGKDYLFVFEMAAKSVITFPSGEMRLPMPGFYEVTGLAWSGAGAISQVNVSTDGGKTWAAAELTKPVLSKSHTRFTFPWAWDGKPAVLMSRCKDVTGQVQPTRAALIAKRGQLSSNHWNAISAWAVNEDGSVKNVHA
jgi:sulfane dehydrogenase subunit SoxC